MTESGGGGPWLRRAVRKASPTGLRIAVALGRRVWRDYPLGRRRLRLSARPASPRVSPFDYALLSVVQDIRKSAFFEGKLANIELGVTRLDGAEIAPGEVFSFWKLVGRPSAAAGFQEGRSIRGGAAGADVGGGLCQLSGIIYEAGLRAGLHPVERHPHSRDLYTEEERFTALGLDATVVWPYKDLRLANRLAVPLQLRFRVRDFTLFASVYSPVPLEPMKLEIDRVDKASTRIVGVVRRGADGSAEAISEDRYPAMG